MTPPSETRIALLRAGLVPTPIEVSGGEALGRAEVEWTLARLARLVSSWPESPRDLVAALRHDIAPGSDPTEASAGTQPKRGLITAFPLYCALWVQPLDPYESAGRVAQAATLVSAALLAGSPDGLQPYASALGSACLSCRRIGSGTFVTEGLIDGLASATSLQGVLGALDAAKQSGRLVLTDEQIRLLSGLHVLVEDALRFRQPRKHRSHAGPRAPRRMANWSLWTIVVIDIVGYSNKTGEEQLRSIQRLSNTLSAIFLNEQRNELFFLPTGDGMIIGFRAPDQAIRLACQVHSSYEAERNTIKIGVHSGLAVSYKDFNANSNYAGAGINMAVRVESCCGAGDILVSDVTARLLKDISTDWHRFLHGPHEFRVKHDVTLRAFAFWADAIGNPEGPKSRLLIPDLNYVEWDKALRQAGAEVTIDSQILSLHTGLAIGNAVLEPVSGLAGLPFEKLRVEMTREERPLPGYVLEQKTAIEPSPNRRKVYIQDWRAPLSDAGDVLTLHLGLTDYWTSDAIARALVPLIEDFKCHKLNPFTFPRQLDCHCIVVTADNQLILACRNISTVDAAKGKWGASVGESIDADRDISDKPGEVNIVNPFKTVDRALHKEELGLSQQAMAAADCTILGLATEFESVTTDLVVLVTLRTTTCAEVIESWRVKAPDKGELTAAQAVNFTIDKCLPIAVTGQFHQVPGELYGTSRVCPLLGALIHKFGADEVKSQLIELKSL
ncbi:MAG: adenylate/guanylate cyclase domain-containing protein [Proteobacteria bacterium]|nr:adenylate/guanylate cyclase domain-containing protein [Pseudomonadota bacterium]